MAKTKDSQENLACTFSNEYIKNQAPTFSA